MTKADHKTNGVRGFEACAAHEILSMTELPPPNTRRWVPRRKAAVVAAVSSGLITIEEACRRYHMSEEEFTAWQCAFENFGISGLARWSHSATARPWSPPSRRPVTRPSPAQPQEAIKGLGATLERVYLARAPATSWCTPSPHGARLAQPRGPRRRAQSNQRSQYGRWVVANSRKLLKPDS